MLNRFEQFSGMIFSINRDIQRIERAELIKYGYKGAYAGYLIALYKNEAGMTLASLCEVCDKDKAAVSRVVTQLLENGLVVKSLEDNRAYKANIVLTDKGREIAGYVIDKAKQAVSDVGGDLSFEERQIMYKSLERIAGNLKKASKGIER